MCTGGNKTEDTKAAASAQDAQAAHLAQPAAFSKDTAGSGAPKVKHAAPKEREVSQPEQAADPLSMARTAPAPGNWTGAGKGDHSSSSSSSSSSTTSALNGSSPGKAAAAANSPPAATAGGRQASAGRQDAGAVWGEQPKPASDWDGSEPAKADAVGEHLGVTGLRGAPVLARCGTCSLWELSHAVLALDEMVS